MKYIVAVDHPYYPYCKYFDDKEEARVYMAEEFKSHINEEEGKHKFTITLAEIIGQTNGRCDF